MAPIYDDGKYAKKKMLAKKKQWPVRDSDAPPLFLSTYPLLEVFSHMSKVELDKCARVCWEWAYDITHYWNPVGRGRLRQRREIGWLRTGPVGTGEAALGSPLRTPGRRGADTAPSIPTT